MGGDDNNHHFDYPRENRGNCRSLYAKHRKAELSVDQQVVEQQVDADRHNAGFHGQECLTALF